MTAADMTRSREADHGAGGELLIEGLHVRYGGVRAVEGIDIRVGPGESVGIIGSNGAGKTSTLKAIMGHVDCSAHRMSYDGVDLARTPARQRVRHGIGYVPEGRHVFAGLGVEENLRLGAYSIRDQRSVSAKLGEVCEIFPVLKDMRTRLAGALSGGQQQMLAIGRALMSSPGLVLFDEPSMGLSPKLVDEIEAVLQRLRSERISMVLVEQNAKLTFNVTDRCLVLENGSCVMDGPVASLRDDPRVRQIYLGL